MALSVVTVVFVGILAAIFIVGGLVAGLVVALMGLNFFKAPAPPPTQCPEGDAWVPGNDSLHDLDYKQRWSGRRDTYQHL